MKSTQSPSSHPTRHLSGKFSALLAGCVLGGGSLFGAVSVTNGDFEATTTDVQDVPSWFDYADPNDGTGDQAKGDLVQGVNNADIPDDTVNGGSGNWLNIVDKSGSNWGTNDRGVYQNIGTYDSGTTGYDIGLTIGQRSDADFLGFDILLYTGSGTGADGSTPDDLGLTLLDSEFIGPLAGGGDSANVSSPVTDTRTITLSSGSLTDGDSIWLAFAFGGTTGSSTDTTQHLIDNVSATAIPEPSLVGLFAGLAATLCLVRRRIR